jgi:hypothetical protein
MESYDMDFEHGDFFVANGSGDFSISIWVGKLDEENKNKV